MLSNELVLHLLPEAEANVANMPERGVQRLVEFETFEPGSPLPRCLKWQVFLGESLRGHINEIAMKLANASYITSRFELAVGFIAVATRYFVDPLINRARRGTDYVFGVVLYDFASSQRDGTDAPIAFDLGDLDARLAGLPAMYMPATPEYHAAPHPDGATATCWAREKNVTGSADLVLSAAHAIKWQNLGQDVKMHNGLTGAVHDVTAFPIDGLLIKPGIAAPKTVTSVAVEALPVVGETFEFFGAATVTPIRGHVTKVHVVTKAISPLTPDRIHLDCAGQAGDSGAMIRSRSSGRAMSLYSGVLNVPGQVHVFSQGLEQVRNYFSIDLWE
jgi:hypothetical protein